MSRRMACNLSQQPYHFAQEYDFYSIAGVQLRVETRDSWPVNEDLQAPSEILSKSNAATFARYLRVKAAVGVTMLGMWAAGETSDLVDWAADGFSTVATWASGEGDDPAGNRVMPEP